jgi:hypothetical protein
MAENSLPRWCLAFEIFTEIKNLPAQFLHSPKHAIYLSINQRFPKINSPAQDDRVCGVMAGASRATADPLEGRQPKGKGNSRSPAGMTTRKTVRKCDGGV